MDIFEAIRADHGRCRGLMEQMESASPRGKTRERLSAKLTDELTRHAEAEEAVFFPTVLDEKDTRDLALEAIEEHRVLVTILQDLEETACDDERWLAKLTVLRELFEHHVEEEEEEIFDEAQDLLTDDQADDMGKEFLQVKEEEPPHKPAPGSAKHAADAEDDDDEAEEESEEPEENSEDEGEEEYEQEEFEDDEGAEDNE